MPAVCLCCHRLAATSQVVHYMLYLSENYCDEDHTLVRITDTRSIYLHTLSFHHLFLSGHNENTKCYYPYELLVVLNSKGGGSIFWVVRQEKITRLRATKF